MTNQTNNTTQTGKTGPKTVYMIHQRHTYVADERTLFENCQLSMWPKFKESDGQLGLLSTVYTDSSGTKHYAQEIRIKIPCTKKTSAFNAITREFESCSNDTAIAVQVFVYYTNRNNGALPQTPEEFHKLLRTSGKRHLRLGEVAFKEASKQKLYKDFVTDNKAQIFEWLHATLKLEELGE